MGVAYYMETAQTGWHIYSIDDKHVYFRYFDGNNLSRLCKSKLRYSRKEDLLYFMSHGKRLYINDFISVWKCNN